MVFRSTTEMMAAVLPAVWGTTSASALEAGAAWAAAGVAVAGVGRPVRRPNGSAPSPDRKADMGVIKIKAVHERRAQQAVTCAVENEDSVNNVSFECPQGSVGYCNGSPVDHTITCGNDCCTGGDNPCVRFTGCVKKDGSCTGYLACYGAFAPTGILGGSCQGDSACVHAFAPNGIEGSCNGGVAACQGMGGDNGEVGKLSNSCQGDTACQGMGSDGGTVGEVSNSCQGKYACGGMGSDGGTVGEVSNSCQGTSTCIHMGSNGMVSEVSNSCQGFYSCQGMGGGGTVGEVSSSCQGKKACVGVGSWGTVKSITDSCNSNEHHPCRYLLSGVDIGHVVPFKRQWRMQKYRTESITECNDLCVNDVVGCSGIKWRQGVRKPCRIFKGRASGNCGSGDVCVDL